MIWITRIIYEVPARTYRTYLAIFVASTHLKNTDKSISEPPKTAYEKRKTVFRL